MNTNVAVEKNKNENNVSLVKRFTRKVQESGILRRVRSIRYLERTPSPYVKKQKRLKSLKKKAEIETLIKLGKMQEGRPQRGRR